MLAIEAERTILLEADQFRNTANRLKSVGVSPRWLRSLADNFSLAAVDVFAWQEDKPTTASPRVQTEALPSINAPGQIAQSNAARQIPRRRTVDGK